MFSIQPTLVAVEDEYNCRPTVLARPRSQFPSSTSRLNDVTFVASLQKHRPIVSCNTLVGHRPATLRWCGEWEKATGSSTDVGTTAKVIRCRPCQSRWPPFSLDVGHKTHLTSQATDHPRSHYALLTDGCKLEDRYGYNNDHVHTSLVAAFPLLP